MNENIKKIFTLGAITIVASTVAACSLESERCQTLFNSPDEPVRLHNSGYSELAIIRLSLGTSVASDWKLNYQ